MIVEGITEESLFTHIIDKAGIHIISVNGCDQVLNLYKRVKDLKNFLHSVNIIFMIDNDTKNKEKFNKIREQDPSFYDSHFIVLEKHEIENYFIDRKLLSDMSKKYELDHEGNFIDNVELNDLINDAENHTKSIVQKKELNEKLHDCIIDYAGKVLQEDIAINDLKSFLDYIKPIFDEISSQYESEVTTIYNSMAEKYTHWDEIKDSVCDGKQAYNEIKFKLAKKLGITEKRFEMTITSLLFTDLHSKSTPKYELTVILRDVLNKLDVKI